MSLCLGTEGSGRFAAFGEKSDLCRGRLSAKDFVAMRKAAKALDDLDIRSPVAAQSTTTIGVARQSTEQRDRAVLVGEILAVVNMACRKTAATPPEPVGRTRERAPGWPQRALRRRSHRRVACRGRCCAGSGRATAPRPRHPRAEPPMTAIRPRRRFRNRQERRCAKRRRIRRCS